MSLEDKFQAHVGELVLFASDLPEKSDLVGYVRGYSNKKVKLTNISPYSSEVYKRDLSWFLKVIEEKRSSVKLSRWDSYEILKELKKE